MFFIVLFQDALWGFSCFKIVAQNLVLMDSLVLSMNPFTLHPLESVSSAIIAVAPVIPSPTAQTVILMPNFMEMEDVTPKNLWRKSLNSRDGILLSLLSSSVSVS